MGTGLSLVCTIVEFHGTRTQGLKSPGLRSRDHNHWEKDNAQNDS